MSSHASYLTPVFDKQERRETLRWIKSKLKLMKEFGTEFNGIVVTGVSGIAMGSLVSHLCNLKMVVIRKSKNTHSFFEIENSALDDKLIFLDDLIESGKTLKKVNDALNSERLGCKIVAGLMYWRKRTYSEKDIKEILSHTWK